MTTFGDTIITSLVMVGMIWIVVLSASFREALAIFAGLAVVTVVLSVFALGPSSKHVMSAVPAASHDEQSQSVARASSVQRQQNIPVTTSNLDAGTPVDVEADVSAVWAVERYDAELRRQCQPCREAAENPSAPITVLKYDASTEFL